ncbi:hypothetical protein CHX26_06805 [Porphyrobacter sp. HT-58-2]|uniref:hypothetical protein n=1 Tax=Porphyrobacter sp. HT-58-2 TaxID=2023229 RepID=UPI000CDCB588|nr:hypothetical protein [Porphyrobacter sp. HT-58-2]AUX69243.1 hypothetical protein CHX26_06805 [Porphyrobacter sp. HT-58-2]
MKFRVRALFALSTVAVLAGCAKEGELVVDQGVGITSVLSLCPAVGIPDYTGDITTFRGAGDTTVASLDVTAAMTDLRSTCNDSAAQIYSEASFTVNARRTDTRGARTVELPYFVTVLRGGSAVISKRIGTVSITFADGQERASATAKAGSFVNRADAALPDDIREKITKRRRAGDVDAALDPLADPEVKAAIARTRFEMLVGFQLTEDQLKYNVTR